MWSVSSVRWQVYDTLVLQNRLLCGIIFANTPSLSRIHWPTCSWGVIVNDTESNNVDIILMMTSSNGNIFRVIGPLCREFTGHKGQWRRALMFSLICVWINGWVNNRKAGDLRRHCAHYDVIVMNCQSRIKDRYHELLLKNCPYVTATRTRWWSVNNGSGNGLVPLPEPMFT